MKQIKAALHKIKPTNKVLHFVIKMWHHLYAGAVSTQSVNTFPQSSNPLKKKNRKSKMKSHIHKKANIDSNSYTEGPFFPFQSCQLVNNYDCPASHIQRGVPMLPLTYSSCCSRTSRQHSWHASSRLHPELHFHLFTQMDRQHKCYKYVFYMHEGEEEK